MRALTAGQSTLLTTAGKRLHYRVWVQDEVLAYQELNNLSGVDWVVSLSGGVSIDDPIPTATIELRRDHAGTSMAPFRGDSSLNTGGALIDVGRLIAIDVGYTAWGATAAFPGDFQRMFWGVIDTIDFSQSNIVITARDSIGAGLVDAWVREETEYGTAAGRRLDLVIQDIITDWAPGITLAVPVLPAYVVTTYLQQPESVWDAIRTLAGLPGWDLRFGWDATGFINDVRLIEPDRAKTTPDWTFAPAFIHNVQALAIDRTWIRNSIRVTYLDAAGDIQHEDVTDATSIARYGEQWAEIIRGQGSPIDTATEANDLAVAALADLSTPIADQTVEVPFFWPLELGDLYRFSANGIHYNSNQDLAVTGHRWEISAKKARSYITCRGKPAGFYLNWLNPGTIGGPSVGGIEASPEMTSFVAVDVISGPVTYSQLFVRVIWMMVQGGSWDAWLKKGAWPTLDGTNTQDSIPDDTYLFAQNVGSDQHQFPYASSFALPGDGDYRLITRARNRVTQAPGPLYYEQTTVAGGDDTVHSPIATPANLLSQIITILAPGTHRIKWQSPLTTAGGWTVDITYSLNGAPEVIVVQGVAIDVASQQYDFVFPRGAPGPAGYHTATVIYTIYAKQGGVINYVSNYEVRDEVVAAGDLVV
jgi:hypothetical protein